MSQNACIGPLQVLIIMEEFVKMDNVFEYIIILSNINKQLSTTFCDS